MIQVSDPSFQNYLKSVCNDYQRWQTQYTLTDVQGKKRSQADDSKGYSPFDFRHDLGQTVKSISPKQSEEEKEEEEEIEQLPVLEGITKYAPKHVLLTGKPGSGKSTALARLLLEEAEKAGTNLTSGKTEIKIPVLVELRYYSSSVLDLIKDWFKRHDLLLNSSEIETLLFQKRFLLLIDGLNEVPSSEAIRDLKKFRQTYQTTPMIFTTRQLDAGGNLEIKKLLEMQPLTEAQSQKFVRAYLAEKGEQLLKQLGNRLREFGQTPLLLWMLCELFRQREEIPSNLGLIFRQFTQVYENKLKEAVPVETDRRQWQYLLQHLAFTMMQGKEPIDFRVAISKQEAKAILRQFWQGKVTDPDSLAIKYLDDLLKYHLIQIGSSQQIEFRHQLLQEYYAAECLLQKLADLSDEEIKRDYLNYLKWTEPIALMLALVDKEEQAVQIVQLALEVDLNLGARLAGEFKPEFQEKTVSFIEELKVPKLLKITFLELTNSEIAVSSLIQALNHEDSSVRKSAVDSLGNIDSEIAVSSLIQALNHEDSSVRKSAAGSLGKIGLEIAVSSLIQALNDKDSLVRRSAADSLGKIGSEIAVSSLIQALNHEDSWVRKSAESALENIGSDKTVSGLIEVLKDNDLMFRRNIVDVLKNIGSDTAVAGLIEALKDKDPVFRRNIVDALENIASDKAVSGLIQVLNDEEPKIRRNAAFALGKISSDKAVSNLRQALKDEDSWVRRNAASALGKIGSDKAVSNLKQALKDEDFWVRRSAASALGKIGSDKAVSNLRQDLKHKNSVACKSAAYNLGSIGSDKAVPELIQDLKHEVSVVRRKAAESLGIIGSDTAVPALIQALKDKYNVVSRSAASALGSIGSDKAVPALIQALKHKDSHVRVSVASALESIGSDKVVSELIQALKDEDSRVRRIVIITLGEIGSERAVSEMIQALKDEDSWVRNSAAPALGKIGSAKILDHLWELQLEVYKTSLRDTIEKIQARCQFYNYEIFNSVSLSSEKDTQNISIMSENSPSSKYSFQAETVQIIETTEGGDVVAHKYAASQKQNLAEAAQEIQQLLEQLAQTNPAIVESPQEETVLVNIEQEIKNNPTIKARLLNALKAGGTEALTQALETVFKNPLVSIPVETIKGFIEA